VRAKGARERKGIRRLGFKDGEGDRDGDGAWSVERGAGFIRREREKQRTSRFDIGTLLKRLVQE